jgi:dTDP-4-dehydrorhamnose 3,5-epimerase
MLSFSIEVKIMPYQVKTTPIDGVLVLEPKVFGDVRGFFFESFNARDFEQATGLKETFVQDNHSRSSRGVLRGLHYQNQHAQGKLVRVTQGSVFDVVVDIRKGSSTFGQWFGLELSAENKKQFWIPAGLAHGFLVTSESAEFLYKTTDYYHPEHERSLLWSDSSVGIEWPLHLLNAPPLLAAKDVAAQTFEQSKFDV